MTGLIANVFLNVLLVGLLAATIAYCFILNRRIQTLQDSKSELALLLRQFDESTIRASETIIAMQTASKKIGDNIQLRIDKANYLLDDLSYAIEKGTRLTSQIEASFAVNRAKSKAMEPEMATGGPASHQFHIAPDDGPEPVAQAAPAEKPKSHANGTKRTPASIEAILEKVVSRKQQMQQDTAPAGSPPAVGRSRAEQELLDLIRSSSKV